MANDQGKTGQQGGTTSNNPGGFETDPRPSEPGQKGGQMPGGQPDMDRQRNAHGVGRGSDDRYQDEQQGAGGSAHQGGTGGHTAGPKSDNGQNDIDEASQAVQDEDSGMTEDNR